VTIVFTAPCPVCGAEAVWTETERCRPEHLDDIDIDCPYARRAS